MGKGRAAGGQAHKPIPRAAIPCRLLPRVRSGPLSIRPTTRATSETGESGRQRGQILAYSLIETGRFGPEFQLLGVVSDNSYLRIIEAFRHLGFNLQRERRR